MRSLPTRLLSTPLDTTGWSVVCFRPAHVPLSPRVAGRELAQGSRLRCPLDLDHTVRHVVRGGGQGRAVQRASDSGRARVDAQDRSPIVLPRRPIALGHAGIESYVHLARRRALDRVGTAGRDHDGRKRVALYAPCCIEVEPLTAVSERNVVPCPGLNMTYSAAVPADHAARDE